MTKERPQLFQLTRILQEKAGTPEHNLLLEFLACNLEMVKNNLINCPPADFLQYQGEARAYGKLIRAITPSPRHTPE